MIAYAQSASHAVSAIDRSGAGPYAASMQELPRRLGGNLRRIRRALGLTQMQFGDRAGMAQSQLSRLENGDGWHQVTAVADAVRDAGGNPEDLFLKPQEDLSAVDPRITEIRALLIYADDVTIRTFLELLRRDRERLDDVRRQQGS